MLNFVQTTVPQTQNPDLPTNVAAVNTQSTDQNREIVVTVAILMLIVCCVFSRSIFLGQAFYWGDIGLFFLPLNHFLKDSLSTGRVPLWNPFLYCGAPYVGNPQVSVLYPSTLLLPLFTAVTAIMISEAAHIFAAGLFFWLLARRGTFNLNYIPSLLSACVYMLCGYFVAKAQFPNMLASLAYVPLLLYQTELLVRQPTIRRTAIFGAALGFQLLAAHTQITVFSLYLMVPYGLFCYYTSQRRPPFFQVLGMGIVGGFFAAGLACDYWLPVAQLIASSARQALTLHIANRFYLPWYEIGNFVLPHLFGSPMRGNWHAHGNYWETDNYVGVVPFLLALFCIYKQFAGNSSVASQRLQVIFWSVIFVGSLWLSLGSKGYLYRLAFHVLPALNAFHDPARLMLGANIAVALFAGIGLQDLLDISPNERRHIVTAVVLLLSVVDLGWHDWGIYPLKPVRQIEQMSDSPVPSMIASAESSPGAGRVLMPDSQRAWQSFTTYKTFEEDDPTFMREWPDTLSPCQGMTYGIREAGGYDPEYRKDSQELLNFAEDPLAPPKHSRTSSTPESYNNVASYLSLLGIKYLVAYRVNPVKIPGLVPVYSSTWQRHRRRVTVYQNTDYRCRAACYSGWTDIGSQDRAITCLSSQILSPPDPRAFKIPVVENLPISIGSVLPTGQPVPVEFIKDDPDDVELLAPAANTLTILVIADTLHPGWKATVDSAPARIYRANGDQKAVLLPATSSARQHTVEFVYRPTDFLVGLYLSLITLLLLLTIIIGVNDRPLTLMGRVKG